VDPDPDPDWSQTGSTTLFITYGTGTFSVWNNQCENKETYLCYTFIYILYTSIYIWKPSLKRLQINFNFSSDEDMHSFMEHHRRAMSVQRERESMARESVARGESVLRESMTRELRSGRDSVGRTFSHLEETRECT
jgi:hypothetical protein